ncbi:MAG: hypothetical protein LQ342_005998 [Letrouitia transgressa]|nr:MAG: hypothetical protein LQ342_005998 [Letrouitia transgressa]
MAFANQFALTLELTRLVPPLKWATNKAGNAIMGHARNMRHSGSDIVVEEDLTKVFGMCRISNSLTSSFKTVVTKSASDTTLLEGIILQGGPGPTVARAFQDSSYFAMVVQISLLSWTFETSYLATAITEALRKRLEGAPLSSALPTSPDRQGILGVIRTCESQTSAFNWNMMLNAVSTTLGYEAHRAPIDFPQFVLRGLLDMFPMVQTLPSDRLIHIQIPVGENIESGASALVVWAHHLLDLVVLVRPRTWDGRLTKDIRFGGPELEQVFIEEVAADDEAFITLLDSQREHLLKIKPEPDREDGLIGSIRRIPARGWGNALLADAMSGFLAFRKRSQAVIKDLQTVTTAFAFIIANNLVKDDTGRVIIDEDAAKMRTPMTYNIDKDRLLQASRFLFDNPYISSGEIDRIAAEYSFTTLDKCLPQPSAFEAAARAHPLPKNSDSIIEDEWDRTCDHARELSIFLIALAHVVNLEDCEDLMFAGIAFGVMSEHPLAQQLGEWNGRDALRISDDAWLQAIAVPLLSHRRYVWNLPWDRTCLISDRGWSAWIPTFEASDPAYINAGSVRIGRGSPCRNGVWKTGIWDAAHGSLQFMADPRKVESCGQTTSLRCVEKVTLDTPYCGEGDEVFLVSVRMRLHLEPRPVQRVGYKELQRYLWWAQLSKRCSHRSCIPGNIKLTMGCATIAGFGNNLDNILERIIVYLTAHSVGARWLALATVPWLGVTGDSEAEAEAEVWRHILLRTSDCCFQCAIDQAAVQPGKWFVIL